MAPWVNHQNTQQSVLQREACWVKNLSLVTYFTANSGSRGNPETYKCVLLGPRLSGASAWILRFQRLYQQFALYQN